MCLKVRTLLLAAVLVTCNFVAHTFEQESQQRRQQMQRLYANNTDLLMRAVRNSLREHELLRQRRHNHHVRLKRAAPKRVCYGELGCFEDSGPFAYLEMLPSPPEEINTKFFFYSTKNRSDRPLMELPFLNMTDAFERSRQRLQQQATTEGVIRKRSNTMHDNETLITESPNGTTTTTSAPTTSTTTTAATTTTRRSSFKKYPFTIDDLEGFDELSVRVIVHGFGSACPHVWIYEMKTALMAVEDCIVICVDWENGATFPNYVRAATNTRLVGKQLAMLIQNLRDHKGLNLTRTHLIGFSLGAHVSGFAGAELPGLARITGLDPAGPLFEAQHPKVRLDSSDADFVDVIHSNGENLILGGLGSWQPMGHVDFYPNGGRVQTGCSNLFVGAVTDFIWSAQAAEDEEGRSLCNHRRAYKFFIDSVAPRCMFPAFPCGNYDDFLKGRCFPCAQNDADAADGVPRCGNMGYYADRSTGRGQLYLVTREEEPFCAHQFQLQIFNSFNDLPLRTIGRLEATLEGEGGLNETFLISEKDDAEFFAGNIVSKIIVPHPALGFPTTLSLHYKSYSGWLSKGLPHWDIDKVVLTDSFGRSHSLCRPSTKLTSGTPVRLHLIAGDCELENQEDYGAYTVTPDSELTWADAAAEESAVGQKTVVNVGTVDGASGVGEESADGVETVKQRKDIFNLGSSFKLGERQNFPLAETQKLPWQPIIEGNSLDREVGESSRSLPMLETVEIFEPILKDRRLAVDSGRLLQDDAPIEEIVEPVLKATTPRGKRAKEILLTEAPTAAPMTSTSTMRAVKQPEIIKVTSFAVTQTGDRSKAVTDAPSDDAITVQLFPFRLGELLQRAEKYARETLLPLISVQAPKFFGFNVGGGGAVSTPEPTLREESRRPRYIPRYEEATFLNASALRNRSQTTRSNKVPRDLIGFETSEQRNLFQLIRHDSNSNDAASGSSASSGIAKQRTEQQRSLDDINYYTNALVSESRAMQPEAPDYVPVFIDLPTFRPPSKAIRRARSVRAHLRRRKALGSATASKATY